MESEDRIVGWDTCDLVLGNVKTCERGKKEVQDGDFIRATAQRQSLRTMRVTP